MKLIIVRHAPAFDRDAKRWPDDSQRPLTKRGAEKFRKAAAGLVKLVPDVALCLTSPFRRASRTAELLEQAGWPKARMLHELEPGVDPDIVANALAKLKAKGSIAIVGHEPALSELTAFLLGLPSPPFEYRKGGAACLEFTGFSGAGLGRLKWLATPKLLRAAR
ncbi:MAG: phosphohistidine phosphatase SixA [Planctomycetes bacterium]|nr:phosphohistidine phosphatase SixA [Planctomycetota bacterium]MCW8134501.1 phosphohistidine phosphatase SixA [Planctomycetota bacterium]